MLTLCGTKDDVSMQTVVHFVDTLKSLLQTKNNDKNIIIGFCGGRSVQKILELLGSFPESLNLDWSRVTIFLVDERWVNRSDKDSNFLQLEEMLLFDLYSNGLLRKNVHYFENSSIGMKSYNESFKLAGGKFDIAFLGAGEDGHVGSLYPDHVSVKNEQLGFIEVMDSPKPPSHRMTISKNSLAKSECTYVLFFGRGKQAAYLDFLNPEIDVIDCPAKIALDCAQCVVATDLRDEI